jgi:hypothetical protein
MDSEHGLHDGKDDEFGGVANEKDKANNQYL